MFRAVLNEYFDSQKKKKEREMQRKRDAGEEVDLKDEQKKKWSLLSTNTGCLYSLMALFAFFMFTVYVVSRMGFTVPFFPFTLQPRNNGL